MIDMTVGIVIRAVVFSGSWGIVEKGMRQEPASKPLKKPSDTSLAPVTLMCSHCSENHWQFLRDDELFTHILHQFAISEYMKYVKPDLLVFRALCYHWWCFMYFYLASKKIYSSGLPLPARHYHTNQRWRLPQLPRSDSQLPKTLCCCSWYWAFSQQWRQPRNWGFWKVLPWVQWWNTPVLSYKYHTPNPKFLHRQRFGWGPLGEKVWRDCSVVGCWANFLFSFSASPCQALLWEKGFSNLEKPHPGILTFKSVRRTMNREPKPFVKLLVSWYLIGYLTFLNVFFFLIFKLTYFECFIVSNVKRQSRCLTGL